MKKNSLLLIAFLAISTSPLKANFLTTLKKYYAPPAIMTGIGLGAWELYNYFAQEANPSWKTYVAAAALGSGILTYLIAPKITIFDVQAQTIMRSGRTVITKTINGETKTAVYDVDKNYLPNNSTMSHEEAQEAMTEGKNKIYKAIAPNRPKAIVPTRSHELLCFTDK